MGAEGSLIGGEFSNIAEFLKMLLNLAVFKCFIEWIMRTFPGSHNPLYKTFLIEYMFYQIRFSSFCLIPVESHRLYIDDSRYRWHFCYIYDDLHFLISTNFQKIFNLQIQ